MSVLAHVGEVVIEGRVSFSLRQLERRLSELLSSLPFEAGSDLDIDELVIEAPLTLHATADAIARALAQHLQRSQR